jgi:hypothetical protein
LGSSGLPLHEEEADYQTVGGKVMDALGRVGTRRRATASSGTGTTSSSWIWTGGAWIRC